MSDVHGVPVRKNGVLVPDAVFTAIGCEEYGVTGVQDAQRYLILWSFETMRERLDEQYEDSDFFYRLENRLYHDTFRNSGRRLSQKLLSSLELAVGDELSFLDHGELVIALRTSGVDAFYANREDAPEEYARGANA